MDTPTYTVTVTMGGSGQTTSNKIGSVLPKTINTRQSGSIVITAQDADAAPFDLSNLNDTEVFAKPINSSEVPVSLGNGVVSGSNDEIFTISWPRDTFSAGWSSFPVDKDGTIVIYTQMEETGTADFFMWSTRVNMEDGDFNGDSSVVPNTNLLFFYTPSWTYDNVTTDADPGAANFRMNSNSLASVTEFYFADDNFSTVDMSAFLQSLSVGATLYISNPNNKTDAAQFSVSGATVNNTGYTTIPVSFVDSGTGSFTDNLTLSFNFLAGGLADGSITNAKLADMAQSTIKGRAAGAGTGVPVDLSKAQTLTLLNVEDGADVTNETNVAATASVTANTAKVTNATHTGDATGDTALAVVKVQGNAVKSETPGAPEDGFVLTWVEANNQFEILAAPGASGGEANTSSDVGGFAGITKAKSVVDLPFKTFQSSDDSIAIADNTNDLDFIIDQQVIAAGTDNDQVGTSYTLVLTDADNKTVWMNNASANELTIPTNASVAFPVGTKINIMMEGAGVTTIAAVSVIVTVNGVTDGSVVINNQYQGATLTKRSANVWIVTGDIT